MSQDMQPERELAPTVSDERRDELLELFWSETNEDWTQEWRDDLTPEESVLVDGWDDAYEKGVLRLMERIVAASERNRRS